jgi:hypothetical protein
MNRQRDDLPKFKRFKTYLNHMKFIRVLKVTLFLFVAMVTTYNVSGQKTKDVFVDSEGVMRWGDTKKEVFGFGINYTTPFAHAYRSGKKLNVDLEKAITDDVYHFSRLGFDAFRVHVWDTEISDSVGNLLDNENLRLFDFMLFKMKERGMKIFLTPIAFWGNGYPDKDEKTPGFSHKYGKDACLVNDDAIAAQEKYLYQFLNHINPYTKVAYKNDPDVVGFEVSNEPHHRGTPEQVTAYINRMVASMKRTGCKKPILYNITHAVHLADTYFKSNIDGGTFQWYPTGLGAGHELRGNFLPNVDRYEIPFANHAGFRKMAKIVYEFDAADVGRSYIYPAMARSFREAGIQWATHFAYDPTFLAFANTEYNTHYMNLVYAPQKALSLKIAGEVFHRVPRYKKYGSYPANSTFENFTVSYEKDLAELNTENKFIYTNHTTSTPKNFSTVEEISGFGNSPTVKYEGRGAYFLDKIKSGVWRLEVMPDAIWIDNVFGWNNLQKQVAVINWREWPLQVNLPDLGVNFSASRANGSTGQVEVKDRTISVTPGVYILMKSGVAASVRATDNLKNIRIDEFAAPATTMKNNYVLHKPSSQAIAGKTLTVDASIVTFEKPDEVVLHINRWPAQEVKMTHVSGYDYTATIPADLVEQGYLSYYFTLIRNGVEEEYLANPKGVFESSESARIYFTTPVVKDINTLYLFNAVTDANEVSKVWRRGSGNIPSADPVKAQLMLPIEKLFVEDSENKHAPAVYDYSLRYNFAPKIKGFSDQLGAYAKIILHGRSIDKSFPVQIAFVDRKGNAFGGQIQLTPKEGDYTIDIDQLQQVALVTLPRPYPTFLPYYFEGQKNQKLEMNDVETLQISVGPGLTDTAASYSFAIESVRIER